MILDRLIIENFGVYAGRQEALLTPTRGKPILLFGGLNGGGKTTLLDAVQLLLYGPKARLSNRGRLPYPRYLEDCIHRTADPGEGTALTLRYRRFLDGEEHAYEVQRRWRIGSKGFEEHFQVFRDGLADETLTTHWDEHIAGFLPVRLSHLFFFDGEQIASLAEGEQTAEIIGSAIDGLLGLDLLERLSGDLKVYERQVRDERQRKGAENAADAELRQAEAELLAVEQRLDAVSLERGALTNAMNPLSKALHAAEERFRAAGGVLFQRAEALRRERDGLAVEKLALEEQLRELLAGPLPLLLVDGLLGQVAEQARQENRIRHARVLLQALEARDRDLLESVEHRGIADKAQAGALADLLAEDRAERTSLAHEPLLLEADEELPPRIDHLRRDVLPNAAAAAQELRQRLENLDERLQRLDDDLARVPTEAHIAAAQQELEQATGAVAAKEAESRVLAETVTALSQQREQVAKRLEMLRLRSVDEDFAADDQRRLLRHAARVRSTLGELRTRAIQRHVGRIETLMLDAFRALLHKPGLVRALTIDPASYRVGLTGLDGRPLPFSRLSAGERQLLATAMLWGLARASGRPVPTIIDTPLGRLDSSHRRNLVERYFPNAAHQVLLLSTDEEIVGTYQDALQPCVSRHYLLGHDPSQGSTQITEGYFVRYEAAS